MGPGCASQVPYIVDPSDHRHVTLTRPTLNTQVGRQVSIAFGIDDNPRQPITDGAIVVTSPGTAPGKGFGSGGPGSYDDKTTHLITVHYEPPAPPSRADTRYFSLSFTPPSAGSYPVFDYQESGATAPCGGIQEGSVGENVVAWINAT